MYKLVIIRWSPFKLSRKEKTVRYNDVKDLLEATDKLRNCEYYVTDENDNLINIDELRRRQEIDDTIINLFQIKKIYKKSFDKFNITIEITQDDEYDYIRTKFLVDDRNEFNRQCMEDVNLFSVFELFLYFQKQFTKLKDIDLVYSTIETIFM